MGDVVVSSASMFISEDSVVLTMVSSSSHKVSIRLFLCLLTWSTYLLFLHSFEILCYIQTYCILYMLKICSKFSVLLLKSALPISKGCVPFLSTNWPWFVLINLVNLLFCCAYTFGGPVCFPGLLCFTPSFANYHSLRRH